MLWYAPYRTTLKISDLLFFCCYPGCGNDPRPRRGSKKIQFRTQKIAARTYMPGIFFGSKIRRCLFLKVLASIWWLAVSSRRRGIRVLGRSCRRVIMYPGRVSLEGLDPGGLKSGWDHGVQRDQGEHSNQIIMCSSESGSDPRPRCGSRNDLAKRALIWFGSKIPSRLFARFLPRFLVAGCSRRGGIRVLSGSCRRVIRYPGIRVGSSPGGIKRDQANIPNKLLHVPSESGNDPRPRSGSKNDLRNLPFL